ncbi:hypothetical protein Pla108_16190 [Botrimarina colliarenosi]|uniref:Uncharacterized protein n=1 Tax=Botrimarina colliarenosi TaxID=2528001 RepID=A0A5C6AMG0_9BACT|nr:hypothetical protein [Botrimarina colliarenosi]TWU00667.1 hypothetical protein Pla108_16190 [Botrimarina colliarenosi]
MDGPKPRRRRWFALRFGLATLLFLTACVAGYLGGYDYGMRRALEDQGPLAVSMRVYWVGDLIQPIDHAAERDVLDRDFDELVDLITSTVYSNEWKSDDAFLRRIPADESLVITSRNRCHSEIAELLKQLRRPVP